MHQPDNPMRDIFCPIQPEVGSTINSGYPEFPASRRIVAAWGQLKSGLQGKALRVCKPLGGVLKRHKLCAPRWIAVQRTNQLRLTLSVHKYANLTHRQVPRQFFVGSFGLAGAPLPLRATVRLHLSWGRPAAPGGAEPLRLASRWRKCPFLLLDLRSLRAEAWACWFWRVPRSAPWSGDAAASLF